MNPLSSENWKFLIFWPQLSSGLMMIAFDKRQLTICPSPRAMSSIFVASDHKEDDEDEHYQFRIQIWHEPLYQKYLGNFLYHNMHGTGFYYLLQEESSSFYSGQLYNNKFQGYGKIFYDQGKHYEGMFKNNKKFGPGIVTYPDTSQDVGFWHGNSLIRLTHTTKKQSVPSLCPTSLSKLKLLRYRKIIPVMMEPQPTITNPNVRNEHSLFFHKHLYDSIQNTAIEVIEDTTQISPENTLIQQKRNEAKLESLKKQRQEILTQLQKIGEIRNRYQEEIGRCVKCCASSDHSSIECLEFTCNCREATFSYEDFEEAINHERFFQNILSLLDDSINKKINSHRTFYNRPVTMNVQHILAWNNENLIEEILLYCFKYRESEDMVNFNVKSLLIGDRKSFGHVGMIEKQAVEFLQHCAENLLEEVQKDLYRRNINPNLSDGRGNAAIHYAISSDNVDIIMLLANAGANLNALNDECVTPLLLTLLRYLAQLNGVTGSWENVFLQETVLNEDELKEVTQWRPHESFENLGPLSDSHKDKGTTKHSSKMSRKSKHDEVGSHKIHKEHFLLDTTFGERKRSEHEPHLNALCKIRNTIGCLLKYGANANLGQVPIPPILLAVYTNNLEIVENLLKHEANPNLTNDDFLTPLHLVATRPFCEESVAIAAKLLEHGADPNSRTAIKFWSDQDFKLIGDYLETGEKLGKTPLHMVALRGNEKNKHQCALAETLLKHGALPDDYLLGHTPASIALLNSNLELFETLRPYIQIDKQLGEDMGNLLTILGLRRFPSISPDYNTRVLIVNNLMKLGANPFNSVYHHQNIYEFFEHDWGSAQKQRKEEEKKEFNFNRLSKKPTIMEVNKQIVFHWKKIGRNILNIIYQHKIMQNLHFLAKNNLLYHRCTEKIAKCFSIDEALSHMRILIDKGIKFTDKLVLRILYLISYWKHGRRGISLFKLKEGINKLRDDCSVPNHLKLYLFDSDPNKYNVCFHCLKPGDDLITCPCCGAVQFCSQICNLYNNKLVTPHMCHTIFYDSLIQKSQSAVSIGLLPPPGLQFLIEDSLRLRDDLQQEKRNKQRIKEQWRKIRETFLPKQQLPRKLTCGFHCGHSIPDIHLDKKGNILREGDFCSCYPLSRNATEPPTPKPETQEDVFNRELKELSELVEGLKNKKGYGEPFATFFDDFLLNESSKIKEKLRSKKKKETEIEKKEKMALKKTVKKGKKWEKKLHKRLERLRGVPVAPESLVSSKKRKESGEITDDESKGKRNLKVKKKGERKSREKNRGPNKSNEKKMSMSKERRSVSKRERSRSKEKKNMSGRKKSKVERSHRSKSSETRGDEFKQKKKRSRSKEKKSMSEEKRSRSKGKRNMSTGEKSKLKGRHKSKFPETRGDELKDKKKRGRSKEKVITTTESQAHFQKMESKETVTSIGTKEHTVQTERMAKTHAYFLEMLAKYFPEFDFNCLFVPFACFIDGQLYYKFEDAAPYYCRTYSSI